MKKSLPNIRSAEIKDAHAIAIIHVASWQKTYHGLIPNKILDHLSVEKKEQQWLNFIKENKQIFIIEQDNQLLGFASICPARDTNLNPKQYGEISAFYLHPDAWRKGLGKKLCLFVFNALQNMNFNKVTLWVLESNQQARLFYEAMGFILTEDKKTERVDASSFMLNKAITLEEAFTLIEVRYQKSLSPISFQPLQVNDLDLLCTWLDKPHVKEWWNDGLTNAEIKRKYGERIGDQIVVPFIIYLDQKPIGFIQYYHADKVDEGWWPDAKAGTLGIDQFIGETEYINKGYGTKIIIEFIKKLFENPNTKLVITDVDPKNYRAIRCYEKVGFKFIKKMMTPDGLANIMEFKKTES